MSYAGSPLPRPGNLEQQILNTVLFLRVGIAGLALAFPWMLWVGAYTAGYWGGEHLGLQDSMSAYYHAGHGVMRDWFVGVLWAIGAFLVLYQGYSVLENWSLKIGGLLAIGVALFPVSVVPVIHSVCAVTFFVCIIVVCLFTAQTTLPLLNNPTREKWYARTYTAIGAVMVLSIAAAFALNHFVEQYRFVAEFCGVYSFAVYWFVKSKEIGETEADRLALRGELEIVKGKGLRRVVQPATISPRD